MTLSQERTALRKWAADKPIEIQGAVRNVCGMLKILERAPNDEIAMEQNEINMLRLEELKRALASDDCQI